MSSNVIEHNRQAAARALTTINGHRWTVFAPIRNPIVEDAGELREYMEDLVRDVLHLARLNDIPFLDVVQDATESHDQDWAAEINEATEAVRWQI
ncbi:hypothetical protein [Nocardia terpenica]|uniref:Uncharacterized protein n=1 Tax=Nocardia terpenica TaxID=455432 RepID=A0A164LC84_9NOCA|nr:hypothetical protein [Nocardia terpenica]KZM72247.1 hypothetical protein AWN90_36850 [Nocardia terpenica]NQE86607.1 hypothetical protein [Nocardia terpenica]